MTSTRSSTKVVPAFLRVCASLVALAMPLLAADDFLHFPAKAGSANGKKVVLLAGDDEYRSEESLPMLGKILSQRLGFDCTVLMPAGSDGVIKPTDHGLLSNPDALDQADAIVMCLRFRGWKKEIMQKFEAAYLRGVPIIALRTSTHAFDITQSAEQNPWKKWNWNSNDPVWKGGFGKQVLGETWVNHHGHHGVEGCRGIIEEANKGHEILHGVQDVFANSDVYTATAPDDATVLLRGQVTDSLKPDSKPVAGKKNEPMQPVVWTRERKNEAGTVNRIVTTTMGAATDLQSEDLRRLIVNGVFWGLKLPVPAKADVTYVDPYAPSMFGFGSERKNFKVGELELGKALPPPAK
ncbi:MAG: ThuA domain-containing protein [Chthoniobacter sp.]|nr:ThuA domain-containing protein [Chthoniobacter sp.]